MNIKKIVELEKKNTGEKRIFSPLPNEREFSTHYSSKIHQFLVNTYLGYLEHFDVLFRMAQGRGLSVQSVLIIRPMYMRTVWTG